jgi:bifunctional DNA-binding transcriptional regulator/antitoxin component of YhaV-PrlF toxin-antitoxin module
MGETKRWTVDVDEHGMVTLPEELLEHTGWQVGDRLKYTQEGDSWILTKVTNPEITEEEEEAWRELERRKNNE